MLDILWEFILFLSFLCLLAALFLDYKFAEPKRWHPLVGFGGYVTWLEKLLNRAGSPFQQQVLGMAATLLAIMPVLFVFIIVQQQLPLVLNLILDIVVLYLCIGWSSLQQHAQWVYQHLADNDLRQARGKLAWIVSRQTDNLDSTQVSQGTVESILENSSDALFASLFWFVVIGPEGAVLHRLVNTLDAMWGYKQSRFLYFGRFAARLDDVLNYLPARLTAYGFIFSAHSLVAGRCGLNCWRKQAKQCESPNGGPVMTAGAGVLNCTLSEGAFYQGEWKAKPQMGTGSAASMQTIPQAIELVKHSLIFWLLSIGAVAIVI